MALPKPQQKAILLKLKTLCPAIAISTSSTGRVTNNWGSRNYCEWDHVSCNERNHVTSIAFDFDAAFHNTQLPATVPKKPNYRVCKIPTELALLDQLETLIIRNARKKGAVVPGPLPGAAWGAPAPPGKFSAFFSLRTLDLSNNGIVSPIPNGWAQPTPAGMPNLRELFLSRNRLTGRMPDWGSTSEALPNLEWMDVSRNPDLKGSVPPGFEFVGQFSLPLSLVTNDRPLLVIKPQTGIGGCVPAGIPLANVVKPGGTSYVPTGQKACPVPIG